VQSSEVVMVLVLVLVMGGTAEHDPGLVTVVVVIGQAGSPYPPHPARSVVVTVRGAEHDPGLMTVVVEIGHAGSPYPPQPTRFVVVTFDMTVVVTGYLSVLYTVLSFLHVLP
jgi:hypothetical protein